MSRVFPSLLRVQLKKASEKLLQEWTVQRMNAQKEIKEYESLCKEKQQLEAKSQQQSADLDRLYKYLAAMKDDYDKAKAGEYLDKMVTTATGKALYRRLFGL